MSDTRYRRGRGFAADMAVYNRQMAPDNDQELTQLKRNLIRALWEDITPRQRETMLMYYGQGLNMREIGQKLGVDKSTVSRTIKRGGKAAAALPALRGGGLPAQHGPMSFPAPGERHGRDEGFRSLAALLPAEKGRPPGHPGPGRAERPGQG